ncbi:hypothetical protein ACQ4XT_18290 [Halobacillus faecis]
MVNYLKFFLFMIVGLSLWQMLFTSFNPVEILAFSFFTTFFKWLFEATWDRKTDRD